MRSFWRDLWIHLLFGAVALALLNLWFIYGILPVEAADEAGHTFVEIPLFFRALLNGHYSLINLFNCFGTPLVGEAVFNPWAPHTLTYLFAPEYWGIMANKVLLMFLTLEVLFHLALRMGLARPFALWAAFMTGTNPAYLYFLNHHPHMGAVLYFSLVLLAFERLCERFTRGRLLQVFASYLALIVGVGINGLVIAHVFLPVYLATSRSRLSRAQWIAVLAGLAGALLIYLPHFISFLEWAPHTVRSETTLFDFPGRGRYSESWLMVVATTIFIFLTKFHMDYTVLQTLMLPLVILLAVVLTFTRRDFWGANRRLAWNFTFAAALTITVYVLLVRVDWLQRVPLFKASDVTRFFWFGMIFVNLGAAYMLERFFQLRRPWEASVPLLLVLGLWLYVFKIYFGLISPEQSLLKDFDFLLLMATGGAILVLVGHLVWPIPGRFTGVALGLTLLPRPLLFLLLANMHTSDPARYGVIPNGVEKTIAPFHRMASTYDTDEAPDQRLALYSIFGSAGRSIVQSRELKESFGDLTQGNLYQYRFRLSEADRFDPLGIAYVLSRGEQLHSPKWEYVNTYMGYEQPYFLYRRTSEVTPVRCGDRFLAAEYLTNEIRFRADADCPLLTATFYSWPGWTLERGDARHEVDHAQVFLVARDVHAGEELRFVFSPWWARYWLVFVAAGLALIALATRPFLPSQGRFASFLFK